MFTGIVESMGTIARIEGNLFTIAHEFDEVFSTGDSIALSGMCATILKSTKKEFTVEIMEESRRRTTFGAAKKGDPVNLERAAKMGDRNSGHFVTGHIDEVGLVTEREFLKDFWRFRIEISPKNAPLVVEKGSVAIDGVSMTVSACGPDWLEVCVILHTFEHTLFGHKQVHEGVNLEFDLLGKYLLRQKEIASLGLQ